MCILYNNVKEGALKLETRLLVRNCHLTYWVRFRSSHSKQRLLSIIMLM